MTAVRPGVRFLLRHPAHWLALGFGSGLSPRAPGTVGTLWGWLTFLWLTQRLSDAGWALVIVAALAIGQWACTRTARDLGIADPGAVVWDEVVAFGLFRYFDAAKPGPVGWADRLFKLRPGQTIGWRQGLGILFDDLVAAGCTLLFIALWHRLWSW